MGKAARDQSARDRVKAQREEQRQKERMRRMVTIAAAVVVALAAVGAGWWVAAKGSESEQVTTAIAPITVAADGSFVMAKAGVEKPVLDVYEDFQCPACKALEETSGATIKNLAAEGKAKVVYHPITIFTTSRHPGQLRPGRGRGPLRSRRYPVDQVPRQAVQGTALGDRGGLQDQRSGRLGQGGRRHRPELRKMRDQPGKGTRAYRVQHQDPGDPEAQGHSDAETQRQRAGRRRGLQAGLAASGCS